MTTAWTQRARRGPGRPPADAPLPDLDEILQRGLEAFAQMGYEAVSVRQLNERLGMGHTFIHDRYGSKEAFWEAVVAHAVAQVSAEVVETMKREEAGGESAQQCGATDL